MFESWSWGDLTWAALKTTAKFAVPEYAAGVEFLDAAKDLYDGNIAGCALGVITGCAELATGGLYGTLKKALEGGVKTALVDAAKKTGTKAAGKKVARELAKGIQSEAADFVLCAFGQQTLIEYLKGRSKNSFCSTTMDIARTAAIKDFLMNPFSWLLMSRQ